MIPPPVYNEYFSTSHLDYLQGNSVDLGRPRQAGDDFAPLGSRTLSRITGIGHAREDSSKSYPANNETESKRALPTQDVLVGLHGHGFPFAFVVGSSGTSVNLGFSVWQPLHSGPQLTINTGHRPKQILVSLLRSLYPSMSIVEQEYLPRPAPRGGIVLGVPSAKDRYDIDSTVPLDRLIRAMAGARWSALVLAEPMPERHSITLRNGLTNEIRRVLGQVQDRKDPSPLANQYAELLTEIQKRYAVGLSTGIWRTAVYLLGDEESYMRLSSVWRGIFSGEQSQVQPVRCFEFADASQLATKWALPDDPADEGPGTFRHAYKYQTLLTSDQLALYAHLPTFETSGFKVRHVPNFSVVPQAVGANQTTLTIGKVLSRENFVRDSCSKEDFDRLPDTYYRVPLDALTKHVFIAGVTGAGKTTTIFQMLKEAWSSRIPFLVIEPAKTEYRELLSHPELSKELQVFTPGDERVSPLRLNPFEVLPKTAISKHIDLLRSLFSASFGLWTPLPQILERCLYLIYEEKGWDITRDVNHRMEGRKNDREDPAVFPTLTDLLVKVDEITSQLRWDREAVGRIRGSLHDRLRSLTNGGRGRMLDVQASLPASVIFERPTVLELESMGDDDDKAFMMGLLLIRLVEFRQSPEGKFNSSPGKHALRHILVFEEAHRLLSNVPANAEQSAANPRAKAVETFANLLSEIRSYGQGVIVADQVPVKLSPDVIKNTNLKVAHRVVDLEDRKLLGGSMVMAEQQIEAVAKLLPGTAAVYSEGDDGPLLVQMNPGLDPKPPKPEDGEVTMRMNNSEVLASHRNVFLRHADCTDTGKNAGAACEVARNLVESAGFRRDFGRLTVSMLEDPGSINRLWPAIESHVAASLVRGIQKETVLLCVLSRAAEWYASYRGSQAGWLWKDTRELYDNLYRVLVQQSVISSEEPQTAQEQCQASIEELRNCFLKLHKRETLPYPDCGRICNQQPAACLYRHPVMEIVKTGELDQRWYSSNPFNAVSKGEAWNVCLRAAEQLVELNYKQGPAIRRIGLCYGQTMLRYNTNSVTPEARETTFQALFDQAEALLPSTSNAVLVENSG